MNARTVKRLFLGLQQDDVVGKTPLQVAMLYAAQQENGVTTLFLFAALLCAGGGLWGIFWHGDVIRFVLPIVALIVSFYALISTRVAINMPVIQMAQAQEEVRETTRLSSAIERLCAETARDRRVPGLGRLAKARKT